MDPLAAASRPRPFPAGLCVVPKALEEIMQRNLTAPDPISTAVTRRGMFGRAVTTVVAVAAVAGGLFVGAPAASAAKTLLRSGLTAPPRSTSSWRTHSSRVTISSGRSARSAVRATSTRTAGPPPAPMVCSSRAQARRRRSGRTSPSRVLTVRRAGRKRSPVCSKGRGLNQFRPEAPVRPNHASHQTAPSGGVGNPEPQQPAEVRGEPVVLVGRIADLHRLDQQVVELLGGDPVVDQLGQGGQ